jgi:hypothetical protein
MVGVASDCVRKALLMQSQTTLIDLRNKKKSKIRAELLSSITRNKSLQNNLKSALFSLSV